MVKFRKGDRVSIETTVRYDQSDDGHVFVDIGSGAVVDSARLTMIAPRFDVGEFIAAMDSLGNEAGGHVKAVCDTMVWVKHPSGEYATYEATKVHRLDPPEPAIVEPAPVPVEIDIPAPLEAAPAEDLPF